MCCCRCFYFAAAAQTFEEAARQAAVSRVYGGIHIPIDNNDGLKLGTRLGENVATALARLSPANYIIKGGPFRHHAQQLRK
jgi:hypothetical protein